MPPAAGRSSAAPARPTLQRSEKRDAHAQAPIIYVHPRVAAFDDALACVSSAYLDGRSLRWDAEAGVAFDAPADMRRLRRRCFERWLPHDADPACFAPEAAASSWATIAGENLRRHPARRRGFMPPYSTRQAKHFGHDVPGIPEELV